MALTIFDHLKNITTVKGPYLGDEGWNNYMINKFLSMKAEYCEVVNHVQQNTWRMEGKHLYNLYRDVIPKEYVFLKYIKGKKSKEYSPEEVEAVAQYFEVSKREAKEYMNVFTKKDIKLITEQINGK